MYTENTLHENQKSDKYLPDLNPRKKLSNPGGRTRTKKARDEFHRATMLKILKFNFIIANNGVVRYQLQNLVYLQILRSKKPKLFEQKI